MTAALLLTGGCGKKGEEAMNTDEKSQAETHVVQQVMTEHGEMKYYRFGKKGGRPYVILPGLSLKSVTGSAAAVEKAYAAAAAEYDVYLIDRITEFPGDYSIFLMAEDTLQAFHELGLKDPVVMGVSQGGMIAQVMAYESPEDVGTLVLCSTSCSTASANRSAMEEWRNLAVKKDGPALMDSFGRYVYTPEFYEKYRDVIVAQAEGITDLDYQNFVISIDSTMDFDVTGSLRDIHCPTFVIGAGNDQVLGVQGSLDLMEKLNCEGYIYEGKGHGVYDEESDYLQRILDYLKKTESVKRQETE